MLGFLIKILVIAGLVVGVGSYALKKTGGEIPKDLAGLKAAFNLSQVASESGKLTDITKMNPDQLLTQVSGALDALVTHPGKNGGPVVLGVKVTNDSLNTVVDVLQNLPPDQVQQIKNAICATPSGN